MKQICAGLWLSGLLLGQPATETLAILKSLSDITGLELKRAVKQETMARARLKDFFEARIKEAVKPEEIRIEELTLKRFGLVPADFDLKAATVELLTEQAAAFYDYRKKKMVLLEGPGDASGGLALAHELAHALADQHFHLERYLKKSGTDDASLARTAVMEGQATWLMSEHTARKLNQSLLDAPLLVQAMSRMAAAGGGFPVFEKVPLYMKESLLFPYTKGMLFQQHVAKRLGKAGFTEVFKRPPETTHEILHPEFYFENFRPAAAAVPVLPGRKKYKELTTGTIGEFDHSVLFRQYAEEESELADKWRGGNYALWEDKKTGRTVLGYASAWDTEESARRAFNAWQRIMRGKWKNYKETTGTETQVTGVGDHGMFVLRRNGSVVTSLEGAPPPARQ